MQATKTNKKTIAQSLQEVMRTKGLPLTYGNVLTPVKTLLESRYAMGLTTFITTNLAPTQIETTYGKRIADRFREMMFSIPFDNPSFRLL